MTDRREQSAEYVALADRAIDEVREVVLDAIRERIPASANPDDGVDEWSDQEYRDLTAATVKVLADHFMRRDGDGCVSETLTAVLAHIDGSGARK